MRTGILIGKVRECWGMGWYETKIGHLQHIIASTEAALQGISLQGISISTGDTYLSLFRVFPVGFPATYILFGRYRCAAGLRSMGPVQNSNHVVSETARALVRPLP